MWLELDESQLVGILLCSYSERAAEGSPFVVTSTGSRAQALRLKTRDRVRLDEGELTASNTYLVRVGNVLVVFMVSSCHKVRFLVFRKVVVRGIPDPKTFFMALSFLVLACSIVYGHMC